MKNISYNSIKLIEDNKYWIDRTEAIIRLYHSIENDFNPLHNKKLSEGHLELAIMSGLIDIFNERSQEYKTKYFKLNQLKDD